MPRRQPPERAARARQIAAAAVGGALVVAALLAIGILLFGEFGSTEGRILATTFLLAAFGVLALPAATLVDRRRVPRLATGGLVLAAAGFGLATATVWAGDDPPVSLAKLTGTVVALSVAAGQTAALAARRRASDPELVSRLFAVSTALAAGLAAAILVAIWFGPDSELFARVLAAGAVLDVLLVALQPILGLVAGRSRPYVVRVRVEPADELELTVTASRRALAAARAIDAVERGGGRRVVALELAEATSASPAGVAGPFPTEGGTMTVAELVRVLGEEEVEYELLPHGRTEHALDEASMLQLPPEEVAKTVVLVTPDSRIRAVIPASERLDLDKARTALGDGSSIRLASERLLAIDYPMFELGAVPPLGGPPGDRILVDRRLADRPSVVFEAGSHDESLRVLTADLMRVTGADVVDVCDGP